MSHSSATNACSATSSRPLSLAEFRKCIGPEGAGRVCVLAAGVHDIDATLVIGRSNVEMRGELRGGECATIVRRGKRPEQLFGGPLISGSGVNDVTIRDLVVDGRRFAKTLWRTVDHRHPVDPRPTSGRFACSRRVPVPDAYDARHFVHPIKGDVCFDDAERITVSRVTFRHPVTCGLCFGHGVHDAKVERVDVCRAGDYGLWAGFGVPNTRVPLPLPAKIAALRPGPIQVSDCRFARCGSAAIYLEAERVTIRQSSFRGNHCEFPYLHDGGQIEIDYRCENIGVEDCRILHAPALNRTVFFQREGESTWRRRTQLFRAVGIEAYGSGLRIANCCIERNSHEAVFLNGARKVTICGDRTRLAKNHTARWRHWSIRHDPIQSVSVTTSAELHQLNAVAADITIEGGIVEHGVMVWSDGSVPQLKVDRVTVRGCDFRFVRRSGVVVCDNAQGASLQGEAWQIENNRPTRAVRARPGESR